MSKDEPILSEVATKLRDYRIPDGVPKDEGNLFRDLELHWQNETQLGFVHPMPTDQQLTDFYAEEYRLVMNKTTGIDHYLSSPNYTVQVQSQANSVLRYLDTRIGRWLDIGQSHSDSFWCSQRMEFL